MMARVGWWRSNGLALIALAVLLPATVAVTTVNEWWDYNSGRAAQAVEVEAGAEASFGGATWSDARLTRRSDGPSLGIPPGTKLMVATVDVTFGPDRAAPNGCTLTLGEAMGAQRQWGSASTDPFDWYASEGMASYCASDATEPYTVEVPFVLPEDAQGPYTIDVSVGEELPRFLRLRLDD